MQRTHTYQPQSSLKSTSITQISKPLTLPAESQLQIQRHICAPKSREILSPVNSFECSCSDVCMKRTEHAGAEDLAGCCALSFNPSVHVAWVYLVPDGLRELSSDIIREVLRHQPEHLNGFIADYLETMLVVRENTRDSGVVICDTLRQGYYFDELLKTKNVTRDQANGYATIIQAAWRGYVVRKKIGEWLKKKKKFEEEKEIRRSIRIEELLAGLGITLDEANRAAGVIQAAYKGTKQGKWLTGDFGEFWVGESVPFGQRIREGDRAKGRFDRWEKEDFGDFFEMDETGAIKYVWPRFGQVRKVPRESIPSDIPIIEFFAMRDLEGVEQYSYLIKSKPDTQVRGTPIGFLVPTKQCSEADSVNEVYFVNPENTEKMGSYTYIFRDDVTRDDLAKFENLFKKAKTIRKKGEAEEFDYDPNCVLPRVLVRIPKKLLLETDDEVKFTSLPSRVVCEEDEFKFRAETLEQTMKIIRHILRDKCLSIEQGLSEAANMSPYRFQETGRIFPVENFLTPKFIQKIRISPESNTGEEEFADMMTYEYIFLPLHYQYDTHFLRGEPESILKIPIARFQGFRSDYKGSQGLENKVFIMGPKINTPNGKPFTYESLFWDEFGPEAWYQLLYNIATQEVQGEEEELMEEEEALDEDIVTEEELVKEADKYQKEEKDSEMEEVSESAGTFEDSTVLEPPTVETYDKVIEAEGEAKAPVAEGAEQEPEKEGEKESVKEQEKEEEMVEA